MVAPVIKELNSNDILAGRQVDDKKLEVKVVSVSLNSFKPKRKVPADENSNPLHHKS
jgi:hypothetical protein